MTGLKATLIAGAVALVLGLLLLGQCQKARTAGTQAKLGKVQGEAATQAGQAAVEAVGSVAARQAEADEIGRENDARIRNAAGADQPVAAAVGNAGRMGLCKRAAYRGNPECLRFTPAESVAGAGAGGVNPAQ